MDGKKLMTDLDHCVTLTSRVLNLLGLAEESRGEVMQVIGNPADITVGMTIEEAERILSNAKDIKEIIEIYHASSGIENLRAVCTRTLVSTVNSIIDAVSFNTRECVNLARDLPQDFRDLKALLYLRGVDFADCAEDCLYIIEKSPMGHASHPPAVAKMRTFLSAKISLQTKVADCVYILERYPLDEVRRDVFAKIRTLAKTPEDWVMAFGAMPRNSEWSKMCIREIAIMIDR